MSTSSIRILLVDDYEPFRRVLSKILQNRPDVHIVCEVSDGLEAVQKAEELQPDLILLDIGLPKLSGIEVARRIREFSRNSKILFVSQGVSADVIQEALSTGAEAYIVKTDAGRELLAAVNAVLRGERFIGSSATSAMARGLGRKPLLAFQPNKASAVPQPSIKDVTRRHVALFCSDDVSFLDELTQFIGAALKAGDGAIVIATESHRSSLFTRLQEMDLNISTAADEGRYVALDAAETLSKFMLNGMLDSVGFLDLLGDLIATAAKAAKGERARVSVFGECVHLLWAQGHAEAAIELEKLSNQLAEAYDVDILCGYRLGGFQGSSRSHIFEKICAEHSAVHYR